MSAAEFVDNSGDLMRLAVYMTQLGLDQRAMKIFRQVAEMEPLWPPPYLYGLKVAQKIDDLEGIQWACVGILSRGWLANQSDVWHTALTASKATVEKLRKEKRNAEADQFEAALKTAYQRDVVVRVKWAGEADVDLVVEEPTGTICSLRIPHHLRRRALRRHLRAGHVRRRRRALPDVSLPQGLQRHL